jgi:alpha-L-glutamate ligase-like protein
MNEILGLNRRNLDVITRYNKREHFPIVDDKIKTKEYLKKGEIPHPETIGILRSYFEMGKILPLLKQRDTFVVKPSRGRAGGGILLLENDATGWRTPSGRRVSEEELLKHFSDILFGVYSFGTVGDAVLIEKRIFPHQALRSIYPKGVADIRIILFKSTPVMAMLRLPTDQSDGKANLHQGAIGVPLSMDRGETGVAILGRRRIEHHPDTGVPLSGHLIPFWEEILNYARAISELVPLGYLGIDFVIDAEKGPLILELNARPGLQIQVVNGRGLRPLITGLENVR